MRRSALFVLVFIMALSAFSIGVSLTYDIILFDEDDTEKVDDPESGSEEGEEGEEEFVDAFTVDDVQYHVTEEGFVEVEGVEATATSIIIPEEVTYNEKTYQVTAIVENALSQNKTLTSVTIAGNIKEIPEQSFMGCTSLTNIEIADGVEKIGESAFEGCLKLETMIIPESVIELGLSLFKDCGNLVSVEIGCGIDEIDKNLFMNCANLESIEIKGDVKMIDESVFEGHKNLKSVKFGGNVDEISRNAFKDCESLESFELDKEKEVKKIGESAFEGCTSLKEFFIPGSLEMIEKTTFKGCQSLEKIEIKTGVKEIYESAFEGCSSLVEITIPGTVKKVGETAFKDCSKLSTVQLEEGVEEIGNSAFEGCGDLKMVTIPASVKEIGESVFEGSSLEELTIPASMTVVKDAAFKNCTELKTLTIEEGVEEIGRSAFEGCTGLTELVIPNTVEKIDLSAFKNCEKIESLLLGEGLTEVGDSAFAGCSSLPFVAMPEALTAIANATFKDCVNIDSVRMSDSLKEIGVSAFEGCARLDSLRLPTTVTTIAEAAFKGCGNLKWVQVAFREPFEIDLSVFDGIDEKSVLQVPKGTRAAFIKEESWSSQFYRIVGGYYNVTIVSVGNGEAVCLHDSFVDGAIQGDTLTVRNDSLLLSFAEGDSVFVSFLSDPDYQIKDISVNDAVVTDSLFADIYATDTLSTEKPRFGEYSIAYLEEDYTVAVAYEKIHYRLTIVAIGGGTVNYQDEAIEDTTAVFRIEDGQDAFVTFSPADNWRIKYVSLKSQESGVWSQERDITSEVPKYQYNIKSIKKHTMLVTEYEEIPVNKYILTVYVSGKGEVAVDDNTIIRDDSWSAFFNEDTTAVLTFRPDEGYATKYLRVNGEDVTSAIAGNQYTITGIRADINVNVSFGAMDMTFEKDGVHYQVSSFTDRQVMVTAGDNMQTLEVPATVAYSDDVWEVIGIKEDALADCPDLAAVIWNPYAPFRAIINNPNALVYVSNEKYVAWADQNAVVDGTAKNITLTDATEGSDFYCPRSFTADKISYTHNYSMETGITESKGWETIALPFDVQTIIHATAGTILPFRKWTSDSEAKPFWLYELTSGGYQETESIKANTPYLLSMPNNSLYLTGYRIAGKVTFTSENVEVRRSDDLKTAHCNDRTFVPNFTNQEGESILALNVNNDLVTYTSADMGSRFVRGLRKVYPFEAYMTTNSNARSIGVQDDMTTGIRDIRDIRHLRDVKVYDMRGVLVKSGTSMDEIKHGLKAGVYVIQGKKVIIGGLWPK